MTLSHRNEITSRYEQILDSCRWFTRPYAWYSQVAPAKPSLALRVCRRVEIALWDRLQSGGNSWYSGELSELSYKGCVARLCREGIA